MYSNIDTQHGVDKIRSYLTQYCDDLPKSMPVEFIIAALSETIFQFGDTHWRQKQGCAMGTSTAVNYAYLCVGILEIQTLLKKYCAQLLFFKRFIDDVIGVWLPDPYKPDTWERFFDDLNSFGRLHWTCDGLTNELIFMDLRIMLLPNGNLHFTTYQKEMNLYLYIPPGSAHPRSMLRGLVFGRLRAYALHNTDRAGFMHLQSFSLNDYRTEAGLHRSSYQSLRKP